MRIVWLEVTNVKRVRAVRHRPDPGAKVVQVVGPNGAGKSSLIDAIAYALGGTKLACPEPLRVGEVAGHATADLGEIVVTRTWRRHPHTDRVTSELEVRRADGAKLPRPQQTLDSLLGSLSFDPLSFVRETPARQLEVLRELVGLDFCELDVQRAAAYADRTALGRELKRAEADARPLHAGLPEAPHELGALIAELEAAHAGQAAAARAAAAVDEAVRAQAAIRAEAERVLAQLVQLQKRSEDLDASAYWAGAKLEERRRDAAELALAAADPAPLRARLADAQRENISIAENVQRRRALERVKALATEHDALTDRISRIDLEKEQRVAGAAFPVPGLGFRHDGITLEGVPFEQASQAQQIRVAVAMGAALRPELRVLLVRDGSLLDSASLAELERLAEERDLQVWLERVAEPGAGESSGDVLRIEDGAVAA